MKLQHDHELLPELRRLFQQEYMDNKDNYNRVDYDKIMDTNNNWHCWRYLKYYSFDVGASLAGMKKTLKWRKENKISELRASDFPKEMWLYGALIVHGTDKDNNIMCYMINRRYLSPKMEEIRRLVIRFMIYLFEKADSELPLDSTGVIVIDMTDCNHQNIDIALVKQLIGLRDCWPARMDGYYIVGIPTIAQPLVKAVISWLPQAIRDKVKCGKRQNLVLDRVDADQLPSYINPNVNDDISRLAPRGSKWTHEMPIFQEKKALDEFNRIIIGKIDKEEIHRLKELQMREDAKV